MGRSKKVIFAYTNEEAHQHVHEVAKTTNRSVSNIVELLILCHKLGVKPKVSPLVPKFVEQAKAWEAKQVKDVNNE